MAGIGDALATYFETRTSQQSASQNVLNGSCTITAMALARLCYDTLLADGLAACAAVEVSVDVVELGWVGGWVGTVG